MKMKFKRILGLTLMIGALICASESLHAESDESEIRSMFKNYTEAFSKHDPNTLVEFWTPDAIYTNTITGKSVEGQDNLKEEFKLWFEKSKVDKLEMTLNHISFPEPGTSIEKGQFKVTFSNDKPPLENAFSAVLVKDGTKWLFDELKQIPLVATPSNYSKLKDLEWLVGDWIDADENATIETQTKWDTNKNFLIQHFSIKLFDQEAISGQQIIGWDPISNIIRSWVFDTDGGFGEGKWSKNGDSWIAKMIFTLSDGSKASAVNIYKKIDENTYSWASEARDVGGEILPNINPIKNVRKTSLEAK